MAVAFTRTNQFILGQGVMLIVGDLEITTTAVTLTPADLGVKKFISVMGNCVNIDAEVVIPVLNSDGSVMSAFAGDVTAAAPLVPGVFPVNEYSRLSFLAV
jgi:hypothetical protein